MRIRLHRSPWAVFRQLTVALCVVFGAGMLTGPAAQASSTLRVGVFDGMGSVQISSSVPADLLDERGSPLARLAPLESWMATTDGQRIFATGPNNQSLTVAGVLRLVGSGNAQIPLVFAHNRWYRGTLELRPAGNRLNVINRIDLEQYLYGVIPAEMSRSWPTNALKSQAVAARSYAIANLGKHASRGYDVCDTDECQVYMGAVAENLATNRVVDSTRGEVITHSGRVIPAYFHSSAGGYTENSEDVWTRKLPFIRAVPDFDQNSPRFTWYKNVSSGDLSNGLGRFGVRVGAIQQVNPLSRSYSGRVRELQIVGASGTKVVSGETFRLAAGLNSTLFNMAPRGPDGGNPSEFAFAGRGWGHGLGLSQWGAKGLAEQGYSYVQILDHYYPGCQLGRRF